MKSRDEDYFSDYYDEEKELRESDYSRRYREHEQEKRSAYE